MSGVALLLCLLCGGQAPPPEAQKPEFTLRWGDLARLTVGRAVSMKLPDGARIQGTVLAIEPEAMVLDVRKTSMPTAWPKGRVEVPRPAVSEFRLRKRIGATWRFAGTAIGAVAGAAVGTPLIQYANNEGNAQFKALAVGAIVVGAAIGYLAGHATDFRTIVIAVEHNP